MTTKAILQSDPPDQRDPKRYPNPFRRSQLEVFPALLCQADEPDRLMNGFRLSAGLAYHHRTPVKKNKDTGLDLKDHNEFTPVIGLTYTPRQYYWWTATGKSTCIPITRPSGSSWHEAYRTYSAVREITGGWRPA